jgi:hypothetical protein
MRAAKTGWAKGIFGVLAAVFALSIIGVGTAQAAPGPATYQVDGVVGADGSLQINETLTFADGAEPFTQQIALTKPTVDYTYYRYEISDVNVTSGGGVVAFSQKHDDDFLTIDVSGAAAAGSQPITISYTVRGAATHGGVAEGNNALTHISWPVLQGLSVDVSQAAGVVKVPGLVTAVYCESGDLAGLMPCTLWQTGTYEKPQPYFEAHDLAAGQAVVFSFDAPSAVVAVNQVIEEHWTLDRAFSTGPVQLLVALGVLIVGMGLLYLLHRFTGRDIDTKAPPTIIGSFVPIAKGESAFEVQGDLRPGLVGTVSDERVDPVDVAATLVDLAVRGHLKIIELSSPNPHVPLDWTFERLAGHDALLPYEKTLLDAIAPVDGPAVRVSEIGRPVEAAIPVVQDQLYNEVVSRGWFSRRPDVTRDRWQILGWVFLVAMVAVLVVLVAFTNFGILGLVLVALGVVLVNLASRMPRKTATGVSLISGLHLLAAELHNHPLTEVPKADAYQQISRVLPYAVVLGARERWVAALVAADDDPGVPDPDDLGWYQGGADWYLHDLPAAFDAFIANVEGRLYARS